MHVHVVLLAYNLISPPQATRELPGIRHLNQEQLQSDEWFILLRFFDENANQHEYDFAMKFRRRTFLMTGAALVLVWLITLSGYFWARQSRVTGSPLFLNFFALFMAKV